MSQTSIETTPLIRRHQALHQTHTNINRCRGQAGTSELEDYNYNMAKPKRRSNSSSMAAGHNIFKTKFEDTDPEALVEYDEDIHGPDQHELEKMSTSSSADTMGSVEEEDMKDTK